MNDLFNLSQLNKLKKEKLKQAVVALPSSSWVGSATPYTQTITVSGVTATNIIICAPEPTQENFESVSDCKVILTGQAVNELTFTAFEGMPTIDLTFNLLIGGEG